MVQGSMSCIKYLLFIFNFIFVICGLVLIIVGALVTKRDVTEFLDSKYVTAPILLIIVGCIIFVVAFLGCCGAVKENHCMVMTFGLLVFIIFVVELAGGISAYMYKGDVKDLLERNMNDSLHQGKEDAMKIWDDMQTSWKCCGVTGVDDYAGREIRSSCCKENKKPCLKDEAWDKGCFPIMLEKVKSAIAVIGGVAIGFAVIELLGCMFAWCLASAIKRDYEGV